MIMRLIASVLLRRRRTTDTKESLEKVLTFGDDEDSQMIFDEWVTEGRVIIPFQKKDVLCRLTDVYEMTDDKTGGTLMYVRLEE